MSKKEEFKEFMRNRPELLEYVRNKEMTLQSFYEIYDVYGNDDNAWKAYERGTNPGMITPTKISEIMKNINLDEIQKHVNTAQKALGIVEDLTSKGTNSVKDIVKGPVAARPLNKFFED